VVEDVFIDQDKTYTVMRRRRRRRRRREKLVNEMLPPY